MAKRRRKREARSSVGAEILLPIRLYSEANLREHWAPRAQRARMQRSTVCAAVRCRVKPGPTACWQVEITRVGKRKLDDDNLARSAKHVRDGVADALEVDDGDVARVSWSYTQKTGRDYAVIIRIKRRRKRKEYKA